MTQIETLLTQGADPNSADNNDVSLLMSFSKKGDVESVRSLIKYGASVNKKDTNNLSAMDYAIDADKLVVVELLVDNGAVITSDSYMLAIQKKRKAIVDFFDSLDPNKHVFLKKRN